MIDLVEDNKNYNYKLYKTLSVPHNLVTLKFESQVYHNRYLKTFGELTKSSTAGYKYYNIFQLAAGSPTFYKIYKAIRLSILDFLSDKAEIEDIWMQSWINFHKPEEVLPWHNHQLGSDIAKVSYNGYISIDPKNTVTEFENYKINNEPGLIYIGPSERLHRVVVNEPYSGERVTIAFDILCNVKSRAALNHGFIPIV